MLIDRHSLLRVQCGEALGEEAFGNDGRPERCGLQEIRQFEGSSDINILVFPGQDCVHNDQREPGQPGCECKFNGLCSSKHFQEATEVFSVSFAYGKQHAMTLLE